MPRSPEPQRRRSDFLPWASPIPREARKSLAILRCAPAASGCSADRLRQTRPSIFLMVAGLETAGEVTWHIGSFKKSGNEYQGEIVTPERPRPRASASSPRPTARMTTPQPPGSSSACRDRGCLIKLNSNEGRDYLSLKARRSGSFTAPIFANLFDDEGR